MTESAEERAARALCNRRYAHIKYIEGDAYDVLKSWALAEPGKFKRGTVGYRAHADSFTEKRREWDDLHADVQTVLASLSPTKD